MLKILLNKLADWNFIGMCEMINITVAKFFINRQCECFTTYFLKSYLHFYSGCALAKSPNATLPLDAAVKIRKRSEKSDKTFYYICIHPYREVAARCGGAVASSSANTFAQFMPNTQSAQSALLTPVRAAVSTICESEEFKKSWDSLRIKYSTLYDLLQRGVFYLPIRARAGTYPPCELRLCGWGNV